jgi:predicted NBD/HSP70 family sugar kinase
VSDMKNSSKVVISVLALYISSQAQAGIIVGSAFIAGAVYTGNQSLGYYTRAEKGDTGVYVNEPRVSQYIGSLARRIYVEQLKGTEDSWACKKIVDVTKQCEQHETRYGKAIGYAIAALILLLTGIKVF